MLMYKNHRILLIAPAYNEELKIGQVVSRTPRDVVDTVLVVDDGSTDRTAQVAREAGAEVISLGAVKGVGFAIRTGYALARERGFDVAVTIAGNNKDDPGEIPRLLDPICDDGRAFVMGSRFLAGGGYGGDMPAYRKVATRLHPLLVSVFSGHRITESTNGFRALKVSVLADPRIDLGQPWLDHYELEVYLLMKLLKLGVPSAEVPVTKIYPPRRIGNTKIRPFRDWWRLLKPIFLVGLGLI
jgi:dolichol-phosphate mannosyltransferase